MNENDFLLILDEMSADFKCPYCGAFYQDIDLSAYKRQNIECTDCGKEFSLYKSVGIKYEVGKIND